MRTAYCFDLDGTITKKEILPEIAKDKNTDLYDEISYLTKLTIEGIIDFKSSFKLRVKLLSTIKNKIIRDIINDIPLHLNIVDFIKANKKNSFIITNNLDCWVSDFIKEKIGCSFFVSKALVKNDNIIEIESIINKGDIVDILKNSYDRVIAIGDGNNDLSMLENSDIGISCGIIHEPASVIKDISDYMIYSEKSLCQILKQL